MRLLRGTDWIIKCNLVILGLKTEEALVRTLANQHEISSAQFDTGKGHSSLSISFHHGSILFLRLHGTLNTTIEQSLAKIRKAMLFQKSGEYWIGNTFTLLSF